MPLNRQLLKYGLLVILLVELLSFLGHFYPVAGQAGFFVIIAAVLVLSVYRLQYGVLAGLAELFIGSQGHLFMFQAAGIDISIRIGLWLVVLAVWLGKMILDKGYLSKLLTWKRRELIPAFAVLLLFVGWGVVNGFLAGHSLNQIFFDANGWLYFAWIFPLFTVAREKDFFRNTFSVFLTSVLWLVLKSFFLLYIFSHEIGAFTDDLYTWVRDTRIGEITDLSGDFHRIFFQSHIFLLPGFFAGLMLWWRHTGQLEKQNKLSGKRFWQGKTGALLVLLTALCFSVTLLSLSRSNWVGIFLGTLAFLAFVLWHKPRAWRRLGLLVPVGLTSGLLALGMIALIVAFPYPQPKQGASAAKTISSRAQQVNNEAGASSRWNLLPELWGEIEQAPVLGKGFGETVTYRSNDPRVLASNPDGQYTTFAFEWGWLDIWLKLGLPGLLSYLALSAIIIFKSFFNLSSLRSQESAILTGFTLGLIAIVGVNFFSPYLNHPLGIGYVLFLSALYLNLRSNHTFITDYN